MVQAKAIPVISSAVERSLHFGRDDVKKVVGMT